ERGGAGLHTPAREEANRIVRRERSRADRPDAGVCPGGEIDEFEARGDERARVAKAARDRHEEAAEQRIVELAVGASIAAVRLEGVDAIEHEHMRRTAAERLLQAREDLARRKGRRRRREVARGLLEEDFGPGLVIEAEDEPPPRPGLVAEAFEEALCDRGLAL